jgi:hypothetical protein
LLWLVCFPVLGGGHTQWKTWVIELDSFNFQLKIIVDLFLKGKLFFKKKNQFTEHLFFHHCFLDCIYFHNGPLRAGGILSELD